MGSSFFSGSLAYSTDSRVVEPYSVPLGSFGFQGPSHINWRNRRRLPGTASGSVVSRGELRTGNPRTAFFAHPQGGHNVTYPRSSNRGLGLQGHGGDR